MNSELSNFFVSYALSEQEFVSDLVEAFRKNGQVIWTDSASSSSESKAQERYARIEAADYFLFIVSPESIASADCLNELAHAVEHEKHVIPIIRREVDLTHPALASTPFFFRRTDNFKDAFKSLLQAVDTDINLAVFISYSRRDLEFTTKLETAFRESRRKVWIDQKDIQHTEEWLKAIYSGIEAADNFIFVISPDSIKSEICAKELAHAVEHNKRIIPVLYRAVNDATVPSSLAKLERVPFLEEDFDTAFQILLTAIDTDLDYVRTHTRLLTRAIEWDRQDRDKSLLLRGKGLKQAEQWRTEANVKKPPSTPLQLSYISASRKDAHRRLMTLAAASIIGLAVIVTLTVVAIRRSRESQRQARSTLSSRLAGEAQKQIGEQPDLAMLLSLEALEAADTFEARSALLASLMRSPKLFTFLRGQTKVPYSMAYSPDGKVLAVGTDGATVLFWDAATRQLMNPPLVDLGSTVTTLAFSPDGKTLATGGYSPEVRLWDVASRQLIAQFSLPDEDFATSVLFSADGRRLAAGTDKGRLILWDVVSRQPLAHVFAEEFNRIGRVRFTDADSKLAAFTQNGVLIHWDSASQEPPTTRTLEINMVMGMDFSRDGQMLAVRQPDALVVYDVHNAGLRFKLSTEPMNGIKSVSFSPDGQRLAVAEGNGDLFLCDVTARNFRNPPLLGHHKEIYSLAFSPDGKTLVSGGLDKNVIVWDVEGDQTLGRSFAQTTKEITELVFSASDKTLFAVASESSVNSGTRSAVGEWDIVNNRQLNQTHEVNNRITSLRLLSDGKFLTAGLDQNVIPSGTDANLSTIERNVVIWDGINPPRVLDQLKTLYQSSVASATLTRDGAFMAAGLNNGKIIIWDVREGRQSGEPLLEQKLRAAPLEFSPDGKLLASGSLDRTVIVWDLQTRQPAGRVAVPGDGQIRTLAFSEDGKLLAVGTTQSISLWDVVNRQSVDTGLALQGSSTCLAFSPDGRLLASGSFNSSVVLWDVPARKPLGAPLMGHTRPLQALSFSNNGQTLASAGLDGKITLWDLRLDAWRSRACEIANRNLTDEEWNRHLGTQERRKTCPGLP